MKVLTARRWTASVGVCVVLTVVVMGISPTIGTQHADLRSAIAGLIGSSPTRDELSAAEIVFRLRLPRVILALCVGFTLSLSGVTFQALLRNPLATPYTLGVASGGALGAMVAIKIRASLTDSTVTAAPQLASASYLDELTVAFAAFLGAMAVAMLVFGLARSSARLSTFDLLLAGVTLSIFCSALSVFLQYLANPHEMISMVHWTMGSVTDVGFRRLKVVVPFLAPAWVMLFGVAGPLNQLAMGEELAGARGVRVPVLQAVCFFAASLATGAVVAVCGPIGFVGLIVPHALRAIVGPDHRVLMPTAALMGGAFLMMCDWVARMGLTWYGEACGRDLTGAEIPVGIITAILGGPFFLVLLIRARRRDFGPSTE